MSQSRSLHRKGYECNALARARFWLRGFRRRYRAGCGGLQCLPGDGTAPLINVRHQNAKCPLPEARLDQLRFAKAGRICKLRLNA